jgi:hypothetical protein
MRASTSAIVERRICTIKERFRGVLCTLPYSIGKGALLVGLMAHVVSILNMLPSSALGSTASPRELMTGRRIRADMDLRGSFGDYILITGMKTDNSMAPRAQECIHMHSSGNLEGSIMALCLATGAVVHRQHFSIVPMTSEAISRVNFLTTGSTRGDDAPTTFSGSDGANRVVPQG